MPQLPLVAILAFTLFSGCRPHLAGPPTAIAAAETKEQFLMRRSQERGVSMAKQVVWDRRHNSGNRAPIDLGDLARATEARSLFSVHCAGCHGERGEGAKATALGGFGYRMGLTMSGGKMAAGVFRLVAKGRDEMPGFGDRLANEQLWSLVALIRAMPLR